jgi:hypothetical protein
VVVESVTEYNMKHLWTLYQAEVRPLLQKYCVSWRDRTLWQADKFLAQHGYLQGSPTVEPRPGKWQLDEVKEPSEPN